MKYLEKQLVEGIKKVPWRKKQLPWGAMNFFRGRAQVP
jgi:hypothetical protein